MTKGTGREAQKRRLCQFFIDTHKPFRPEEIVWPDLDAESRARLAALPIWDEAVNTEAMTALVVETMARTEPDPVLSEAIALQGYEEGRHAALLRLMTRRYDIPVTLVPPAPPADPAWAFMRIGYGECFDSFFAFGLFALARDSGFFPGALVEVFEPVMQEEARHIIFHVNWVAYRQASLPFARRPTYVFRRGLAMWLQVVSRLRTALRVRSAVDLDQDNFTMKAHHSFGDVSADGFVRLCLAETERRLAVYDPALLRPGFVPAVARAALAALPRDRREPAR
jgi:hypothetical protein